MLYPLPHMFSNPCLGVLLWMVVLLGRLGVKCSLVLCSKKINRNTLAGLRLKPRLMGEKLGRSLFAMQPLSLIGWLAHLCWPEWHPGPSPPSPRRGRAGSAGCEFRERTRLRDCCGRSFRRRPLVASVARRSAWPSARWWARRPPGPGRSLWPPGSAKLESLPLSCH